MKSACAIALVAITLTLAGCASLFTDSLDASYQSGEISKEEYESGCQEREAALALDDPAHWELQQTISENRAKLASE